MKTTLSNCLATTHKDLAKQWHPTKNFPLTPFDVTFGSHKKAWWKCNVYADHEWQGRIADLANGSGCPCCGGDKIVLSNCLSTTHPEIAKQWHPFKNNLLTPFDIGYGSNKKIWWKCDEYDDHEWEASPNQRTNMKSGCPCCKGSGRSKKVVISNCLAITHPEIAKQWHPTKNLSLTPFDITFGSHKKVWWKCNIKDDHEWIASINSRINGKNGCSCCSGHTVVLSNCLAITHPEIVNQWHPTKNLPLTPLDVTFGSHEKIWWKCPVSDDHEWISTIQSRTSVGSGCPCCSGDKVVLSNCLLTTHPELSKQWHPAKNLPLTPFDVVAGSSKKVWWQCDVSPDHEWQASLGNRSHKKSKCPCCCGQKAVSSNCLATTHPEIIKQWHPFKNLPLTYFNITAGSGKKVWWICDKQHQWKLSVHYMANVNGDCPYCCSLAITHPELSKEWHPTKNEKLTAFDVTFGSVKKVWWKCNKFSDHDWITSINGRTNSGSGCPWCNSSHGERKIKTILSKLDVKYESQKRFTECKHKFLLPFDFYLPLYNALIEYDGEQHFKPRKQFGGIEAFKIAQNNDNIKTEYAAKNNIPLLRIPYTKFDSIEQEIKSFIGLIDPKDYKQTSFIEIFQSPISE